MAIGGVKYRNDESVVSGQITTSATLSAIHVLTYDESWAWRRWEESLPRPRWGSAAVCLPSGELLVVGGYNDKGYVRQRSSLPASLTRSLQFSETK